MSFLLDALKKSEQERQQSQTPDLQTEHVVWQQKSNIWRWVSIVFVMAILNVGVYVWFFTQEEKTLLIPVKQQVVAVRASSEPIIEKDKLPFSYLEDGQPKIKQTLREHAPLVVKQETQMHVKPVNVQAIALKPENIVLLPLKKLTLQQRHKIGHLNILAHFFNSKPQKRVVMINGKTWHEGQYIRKGLRIEEITESGVVFHLVERGLHFQMDAFQELNPLG